jgi:hypothetical protein
MTTTRRSKNAKITKVNQHLRMATLKNVALIFKNMSESFSVKSKILRDTNDNALFGYFGRQHDIISQGYFKLREEQGYLDMQKPDIKLRKDLPRSTQTPLVKTVNEEEEEEEEVEGLGRSSFYGALDLNFDAGVT